METFIASCVGYSAVQNGDEGMKKTNTYTQCLLRRNTSATVAWIPTEFAGRGRILDIKMDGKWERGWTVADVMGTQTAIYVEVHETDYKKQRKASDI